MFLKIQIITPDYRRIIPFCHPRCPEVTIQGTNCGTFTLLYKLYLIIFKMPFCISLLYLEKYNNVFLGIRYKLLNWGIPDPGSGILFKQVSIGILNFRKYLNHITCCECNSTPHWPLREPLDHVDELWWSWMRHIWGTRRGHTKDYFLPCLLGACFEGMMWYDIIRLSAKWMYGLYEMAIVATCMKVGCWREQYLWYENGQYYISNMIRPTVWEMFITVP